MFEHFQKWQHFRREKKQFELNLQCPIHSISFLLHHINCRIHPFNILFDALFSAEISTNILKHHQFAIHHLKNMPFDRGIMPRREPITAYFVLWGFTAYFEGRCARIKMSMIPLSRRAWKPETKSARSSSERRCHGLRWRTEPVHVALNLQWGNNHLSIWVGIWRSYDANFRSLTGWWWRVLRSRWNSEWGLVSEWELGSVCWQVPNCQNGYRHW